MLSSDELHDLIDSTNNSRVEQIANNLVMALNDWPTTNLTEPHELIQELNQTITGKLTFKNLSIYANSLSPISDSWKLEALTSIIAMFDTTGSREYYDLEEIINRLSGEEY